MITIEKKRETINDEIQYMIDKTINQQAKPELVTITKIYEDDYVDCVTENDETLECIPVIKRSNLQVDDDGILFLLSNEMYYVIA